MAMPLDPTRASDALRAYVAARDELLAAVGCPDSDLMLFEVGVEDDGTAFIQEFYYCSGAEMVASWAMADRPSATRVAVDVLEGRLVDLAAAFDATSEPYRQYDNVELRRLSRTLAALRTHVDAALDRRIGS